MNKSPLLIILGPTASGKTRLAVSMAAEIGAEIISADSRQVFRGMDIGTGKDLTEYCFEGKPIPYHLIDIRDAGMSYNVNEFKSDFYHAYSDILSRAKVPLLCGGTGMYIHSILQHQPYTAVPVDLPLRERLQGESPEELKRILQTYPSSFSDHADLSSSKRMIRAIEVAGYLQNNQLEEEQRVPLDPVVIGLTGDVEHRRQRIMQRLESRLKEGLIEEVARLLAEGVPAETLIFYGLEYKFVTAYLQGEFDLDELKEKVYIAIRQFAKRQMTFFRKMEKDGVMINWLDCDEGIDELKAQAMDIYLQHYPR